MIKASAVVSLLLNSASAVTDHADGLGGDAPCIESFLGVFEDQWGTVGGDPHAVHGIFANDKSIVSVGGGYENSDNTGGRMGFIIRTNAGCTYDSSSTYLDRFKELTGSGTGCDQYKWATRVGASGKKAEALWVAESNDQTYYIAVGYDTQSGADKSQMAIWKINASDGALVWTMNYGDAGTVTGLESVDVLSNGDIIVGGYIDSEDPYSTFKSGGQVTEGKPFLAKISKSNAGGSSAPSSFDWTYSMSESDYTGSAKAIRIDSSDNIYAVVGVQSAAVKLNSSGTEQWKTGQLDANAQMNDLQLATDGLVLAGLEYSKQTKDCWFQGCGVIKGKMIKLDTNGAQQWSQTYGNYPDGVNQFAGVGEGNWALVYNECWGVTNTYDSSGTADGYALACGIGIEGCGVMGNNMPHLYLSCLGDPRVTWRALTVATDLNGERVWSRMDSYQTESWKAGSTASEYILSDSSNQKLTFVTDNSVGFGFATISAPDGTKCADEVSAVKLSASALIAIGALYLSF